MNEWSMTGGWQPGVSVGMVGTFPPTECGLATFAAALGDSLRAAGEGCRVGMVEVVDAPRTARDEVVYQVVRGDRHSVGAAPSWLNRFDVVVVQHEFGIFGGVDGDEVLDILDGVHRPVVTVLHTVLEQPSVHQRDIIEQLALRSAVLVVMTLAARSRLLSRFAVDPRRVVVIPHGAHENRSLPGERYATAQPTVLTWGLLGPGKGIEMGIDAIALLRTMIPAPRYLVAGQTHPKVRAASGEAYRESLQQRAAVRGVADLVEFDDDYRNLPALQALNRAADLVLLPYESRDQVTSGVLIEAVASRKPVVATDFPHARELLSGGAGIVVPHNDAEATAQAVGRILRDHRLARQMADEAARLAAPMMWSAVARRYHDMFAPLLSDYGMVGAPVLAGAGVRSQVA
jgi:glycosyltransferase involved in cell wall biosynthesis